MSHPLLDVDAIELSPDAYVHATGQVFAIFDERTQDSGNISYGVRVAGNRYFVKTAGLPGNPRPYLAHTQRVALLRNAVRLRRCCDHITLTHLQHVIESPNGPLLIYEWVEGEHIGADHAQRSDPDSAFQRFRRLPAREILRVLDLIFDLHYELAQLGWIAVDFYDGCMIYDFERQELHLVDLDMYRENPFTNDMGRMFGSSRFMAPEEFELGATIDQRSNVFSMGRTAVVLLSDGMQGRSSFRGNDALYQVILRACSDARNERYVSMAAFYSAWREARLMA